jgi:hypothetical protein
MLAGVSSSAGSSNPHAPKVPPIPGQHTRIFAIDARGTQNLSWHYAATIPPCASVSGQGTERLTFSTNEGVKFKFLAAHGYATFEPKILAPLNAEVGTTQERSASVSATSVSPCPPPPPPPSTADCGKVVKGSAQTLDLEYTNEDGGGIKLNLPDINNPYSTGATFHCPDVGADSGPLADLLPGDVEPYGTGLFMHFTIKQLLELKRFKSEERSKSVKLKADSQCAGNPYCTSSGSITWSLTIIRVK